MAGQGSSTFNLLEVWWEGNKLKWGSSPQNLVMLGSDENEIYHGIQSDINEFTVLTKEGKFIINYLGELDRMIIGHYPYGVNMTFGEALVALKCGQRVARSGWNGKGMWIMLCEPPTPTYVLKSDGKEYKRQPYIYMKTAQDTLVPWTASQDDILAEDWQVVE